MNRLTKKAQFIRNLITGKEIKYISNESDQMCVDKLGTLEDIQEELDIDLIKAIELCKQVNSKKVIYIKDEWGTYPIKILDNLDVELFNHRLYNNFRGIYVSLDLFEYGKTWALTKEELLKGEEKWEIIHL